MTQKTSALQLRARISCTHFEINFQVSWFGGQFDLPGEANGTIGNNKFMPSAGEIADFKVPILVHPDR